MRISRWIFVPLLLVRICAIASDKSDGTRLSSLPVAAQSRISAVLGRDTHNYQVKAFGIGFTSENSRQRLTASFTSEGVEVRSGTARWGMSLEGYGYGEALETVTAIAPHSQFNRVEYRRVGLTEW